MPRTLPVLRVWNQFFCRSGEDGGLRFQRCETCDALQHPPAPVCRMCGGAAVTDAGLAPADIDGLSTYPAGAAEGGYAEGGLTPGGVVTFRNDR